LKLQRPLKDKELKILDKRLSQLDKNFKRQVRFLLIWTLLAFVVGTFAYFKMNTNDEILLLVVTVAIYIAVAAWVSGKEYLNQQKERKSIAFLKNKNLVTAIEVNSTTAVRSLQLRAFLYRGIIIIKGLYKEEDCP